MGYSSRVAARCLLYAPQDSICHDLCYISCGVLVSTKERERKRERKKEIGVCVGGGGEFEEKGKRETVSIFVNNAFIFKYDYSY